MLGHTATLSFILGTAFGGKETSHLNSSLKKLSSASHYCLNGLCSKAVVLALDAHQNLLRSLKNYQCHNFDLPNLGVNGLDWSQELVLSQSALGDVDVQHEVTKTLILILLS